MNPSSFVKDIGRSFFVSSFLPAALFVSVGILILQDFFPKQAIDRIVSSPYIFGSEWLISILLIAWVSFGLYSILPWTLKFYEGYYFPKPIQSAMILAMSKFWHAPKSTNITKIRKLKDDIRNNPSLDERDKCLDEFGNCRPNAVEEYLNLEPYCPVEPELLLPTRLGNLLRSSMYYPKRRYNIDGYLLWPRLKSILPREFLEEKDDSEARLIFMLNSSLLAYLLSVLSMLGGLLGVTCPHLRSWNYCLTEYYKQAYSTILPVSFLVIGIIFGISGYFLYSLAVSAGETFSSYVRTGFDLYRFDLLRKLNFEIPGNIEKERKLWDKVNELFIAGDDLGLSPLKIVYKDQNE